MRTDFPESSARQRAQDPISRFECKYLVEPVLLAPLRQFVRNFSAPDPMAARAPDHRYAVCSLYLDTEDLHFYQQYARGERTRFKLRARTYGDDCSLPVFLEVKWRVNREVFKQRAVLSRDDARLVLEGQGRRRLGPVPPQAERALDAFTTDRALTSARPVVRVRYRREAYVAPGPDAVRVTFDTDVEFQPTFGPVLWHKGGEWSRAGPGGVVVELKFPGRLPRWTNDMIGCFGLVQRPCCKYALSIDRMAADGRRLLLGQAGFRVPASATGGAS